VRNKSESKFTAKRKVKEKEKKDKHEELKNNI